MRPLPPFAVWVRLALAFGSTLVVGCGGGGSPPDAGPQPTDECVNANDIPIARMTQSGDAGIEPGNDAGILSIGDYYANCATGDCLAETLAQNLEALDTCMVTCTAPTPASGLTPTCRTCYEELVICAGSTCGNLCILDPTSQGCIDCYTNTCVPPARLCTGIERL